MLDQFTDRARKVLELANDEAQQLGHEYIGTEHLLLGLVAEGTGVAANVLRLLGLDADTVRREVLKIVQYGKLGWGKRPLPQTPRAKKVLECAIDEALHLEHTYIGTEHLLLGMMREEEGVAAQILINLGMRRDTVRQEVVELLGRTSFRDVQQCDVRPRRPAPPRESEAIRSICLLPEFALAIIAEFDRQLDILREQKEKAVATQRWDEAVRLRDIGEKLEKFKSDFWEQWAAKLGENRPTK